MCTKANAKFIGERMEIHMNISFPQVPCELLTLDVMDVSGEIQAGVMHGVNKVRTAAVSQGGDDIAVNALNLHDGEAKHLEPNYCGQCYGAPAPPNAAKTGCCNTCSEVRDAYASVSWSFGRGENVEQCEREHYGQHLDEQEGEGCRVEGAIRVNKVIGNFHFAPGKSFSKGMMHVHDLENYFHPKQGTVHTFSHVIHHLRFGPELPEALMANAGNKGITFSDHHVNALDNTEQHTEDVAYNFMYFVKVVSTAYLPLGWRQASHTHDTHHDIDLGDYGLHDEEGSIESHQYSVTSHRRSLRGGDDSDSGHKEGLHAQGGIPGVFFSYVSDMSSIVWS